MIAKTPMNAPGYRDQRYPSTAMPVGHGSKSILGADYRWYLEASTDSSSSSVA